MDNAMESVFQQDKSIENRITIQQNQSIEHNSNPPLQYISAQCSQLKL